MRLAIDAPPPRSRPLIAWHRTAAPRPWWVLDRSMPVAHATALRRGSAAISWAAGRPDNNGPTREPRHRRLDHPIVLSFHDDFPDGSSSLSTFTGGIRGGLDGVEQLHVTDVIQIDLFLEHDGQSLAVEPYGEDRGWKGQLADGRLPLPRLDGGLVIRAASPRVGAIRPPWCS